MKIIYEFNTTDENFDIQELNRIQSAESLTSCIYDIQQQLRSWYKYDERPAIPTEEIQDKIYDIIREHNIDIDKLWS